MISGRAVGLDINRGSRAVVSLSVPSVSHITLPTILIDIQSGVFAAADARSRSAHKEIRTKSLNRERLRSHLTTLNRLQRNSIDTSRNRDALFVRTSAPSPLTLNIGVSSQDSAVVLAKRVDTADGNSGRSRIDSDNASHSRHFRSTTGSRQRNHNRVVVVGHVIVGSIDILAEGSLVGTLNQNTISVPSIDSLTRSAIGIDGSGNRNLGTVTNRVNSDTVHRNIGHNRDRIHNDFNLVVSPALRVGLTNHHTKRGGLGQVGRVGGSSCTRNVVTISLGMSLILVIVSRIVRSGRRHIVISDLVPLIDNVLSIIIIQVSGQSDLTIGADLSFRCSDVHNRLRIDIDQILGRHGSTTGGNVITLNIDRESVRLGACIEVFSIEAVVAKVVGHVVSDLTRLVPSVVERTHIHTGGIDIGNQEDRVSLTDVLVTRDHNNRIRVNRHNAGRSGSNRDVGGATSLRAGHNSRIDVLLRVIVNSSRSVIDGSGHSTRDQDTVSVPSIDLTSLVAILRSSRNRQLTTVADVVLGSGDRSDNRNLVHSNRDMVRGSVTQRGELVDSHMIIVRTKYRNNRVAQLGGTSDSGFTIIPLEGKLVSVPVIQRGGQRDLTTLADVGLRSRDVHNRSSVDINQSLARSGASILIDNLHGEAVRIVSVRFRQSNAINSRGGEDSVVL